MFMSSDRVMIYDGKSNLLTGAIQRVQRRKVRLIMNGSRVQVEILNSILEHSLEVTSKLLKRWPHSGLLVPTRDHQFVSAKKNRII